MDSNRFIGTWRLISFEARHDDGRTTYPLGEDAVGVISYDAQGHVAVQLMRRDRPRFASSDQGRGTAQENQAAVSGYVAYFGAYELGQDNTVVHHLEGSIFPNWIGVDHRRFWEFSGDRLILSTPPITFGGETAKTVLVWERIA